MTNPVGKVYSLRGKLTAREINEFADDRGQATLPPTGSGAPIPIVYGTSPVSGRIIAQSITESPNVLYLAVAWGYGEFKQIKTLFINDELLPDAVEVKHYRGATYQTPDAWLAAAIAAYTDDVILNKPGVGNIGIAYSVLKIPTGAITGISSIKAIVDGKLVADPDDSGTGDPFINEVGLSVEFTAASPLAATDDSTHGHAITFGGNPDLYDGQLWLDGAGDYATVAAHSSIEFGDGAWSIELRISPDTISGTDYILTRGDSSSPNRSFLLFRQGDEFRLSMGSAGSSFDICNSVVINTTAIAITSPLTEYVLELEYDGRYYTASIDGARVWSLQSDLTVYDNSYPLYIGALNGGASNTFGGGIRAIRNTIGVVRYFGEHSVGNTPFSDSDTFTPGTVFSDNPALCWADLASSPFYGLGATVSGTSDAAAWCNELLGGAVERSRCNMAFYTTKRTEEYLDLLATAGDCTWLNEGDSVKIIPDKPITSDNPNGQDVYTPYTFPTDTNYTKSGGFVWFGGFYVRAETSPETLGQLARAVEVDVGVEYVVEVVCTLRTSGTFTVNLGGTQVIASQNAAGTYSGTVIPSAASPMPVLSIDTDAAFNGWFTQLRIRRKFWLETQILPNSIKITSAPYLDTPTRVNVRWREQSNITPTWQEKTATYTLPGVAEGDLPLLETTINMPFIYRAEEAANKAEARCHRLQNKLTVEWGSADMGLIYQKGDGVHLRSTHRGVDLTVKLTGVNMGDYGRYANTGDLYSLSHYPSELQEGTGTVPIGGIIMLNGTTVPSGWALFADANGLFIKAWNDAVSPMELPGATGGSATHAAFTGNTENGGAHQTSGTVEFPVPVNFTDTENGVILKKYEETTADKEEKAEHLHTYDTGLLAPEVYRREQVLIKKTGSSSLTFPSDGMVFGLSTLSVQNLVRSTAFQGRLLKAAAANVSAGVANEFVSVTSGSADDTHDHHTETNFSNQSREIDFTIDWYEPGEGGGPHTHAFNMAVSKELRRFKLSAFAGTADFTVGPGTIIMWDGATTGSPDPLPTDWVLCDGTNGTPDLRGFYVEVAAEGEEETSTGDNTLTVSTDGAEAIVTHDHDGAETREAVKVQQIGHKNAQGHSHTVSASDDWEPPYYVLAFIMYKPGS